MMSTNEEKEREPYWVGLRFFPTSAKPDVYTLWYGSNVDGTPDILLTDDAGALLFVNSMDMLDDLLLQGRDDLTCYGPPEFDLDGAADYSLPEFLRLVATEDDDPETLIINGVNIINDLLMTIAPETYNTDQDLLAQMMRYRFDNHTLDGFWEETGIKKEKMFDTIYKSIGMIFSHSRVIPNRKTRHESRN